MRNLILIFFFTLYSVFTNAKIQMITGRKLADANWGTHMPVLITAAMKTTGPILEFGCGDFSTPLLHAICSVNKRFILSVDSDKKWLENFLDLETDWHKFIYVNIYDENNNLCAEKWEHIKNDSHWGLIFIDHHPGCRRVIDIERFKNKADVIVIHDTQKSHEFYYNYQPIISKFKYKFIYERYERQTTIVSNFINVENFFKE